MASDLFKLHLQTLKTSSYLSTQFPQNNNHHVSFFPSGLAHKPRIPSLSIHSSMSPSTPPTSKEEAILQAKTCLSTTLEKPLNNPKLVGKVRKLKQPRLRVEIPVSDDTPVSLSQLSLDIFKDLPVKRKGSPVKILILWPSPTLKSTAVEAFQNHAADQVLHADISSVANGDGRSLSYVEAVVFLAPERSQLQDIKAISESLHPKPVVIFNPKWDYEEEESGFGDLSGFIGSFEVIYSFTGLEVRGVLSKRKGVIFKCVRDGVVSGERWSVLVEEEGELKVISRFKARPSIGEVQNVLYNLMAINSPITKSAKFLRDLVSNLTGKKS